MSEPVPRSDVVDRAAAEVRATPVPDAPAGLMAAVTLTVAARIRRSRRRRIMRRLTLAAATACLAVAALALWPADSAARVLQQAADKAKAAKSVRKTERVSYPDRLNVVNVVHQAGNKTRRDHDDTSHIYDAATGVNLSLDHSEKTARRTTFPAGVLGVHQKMAAEELDPLRNRAASKLPVHKEPDAVIDGRAVQVSRIDQPERELKPPAGIPPAGIRPAQRIYFSTDVGTGRLRRIVNEMADGMKWVVDYEMWDEEIDPKLFSQDVPAGYTLVEPRKDGLPELPKPRKPGAKPFPAAPPVAPSAPAKK